MELEKHRQYKTYYGENEVFWGLGIEEETYLETTKPIHVAAPILRTAHKRERYSVNYYESYKPETLGTIGQLFTDISGFYTLPFFFNAHSLTKMDVKGRHATIYQKQVKPNPAFSGKSYFTSLQEFSPDFFVKEFNKSFTFDGDTVEFISQDFYKANVFKVIKELLKTKGRFLKGLNRFCKEHKIFRQYGTYSYPSKNPGFAVFHSNPTNIAIFNNGTYHINITLPSLLGAKTPEGIPTLLEPENFKKQHKNCIRMLQWMEPLWIAMYGTDDPFPNGSRGSQRCAMSRYIGIGTYDTSKMSEGKIVTIPTKFIRGSAEPFWWYKVYHEKSAYTPLKEVGLDICYKKHYLHGIELRIFDWFPEEKLYDLIRCIVYAAEASLLHNEILEPQLSKVWNDLVVRVLQEGQLCEIRAEEMAIYDYLLGIPLLKQSGKLSILYKKVFKALGKKYGGGYLSKCFLSSRLFTGQS
jgi:hypothetical protein